ncbi:MAG TPA: SH3 domain-containing protein [Acidimicrobiales bacterium]|nr:SH3 domain-containing protein [Acidimicrobiales bacterium]
MAALRVQLKPKQMAAALQVAGLGVTPRSPLGVLPAVASDAAARKALQGTGLLDSGRDGMSAATKTALAALADPHLLLVIMANRTARPEWVETMLLTHGPGAPFVAYAGDGDHADVAILPSAAHALVLIDELAGLSHLPAVSGTPPVELDVAAFGALVAAADVVQATKLEGMLDRQNVDADITLTADALEDRLERGMEASDPRWAVDAARAVSPPVFAAAAGRAADGLVGLEAAGVVASSRGGYTLTATGTSVALSLARLIGSAGITVAASGAAGDVDAAQLGVLRSVDSIWMAAWGEVAGDDARVTVYQASATTALRLMNALLDPLSTDGPEGATPSARRRTTRTARARRGAAPVSQPAPASAPAPSRVWAETHLVPRDGLAAWAVPDGNQPSVATLDADLPVQVIEEQNDWAHIVCSNGWEAWVDRRRLVAL